MCRCVTVSDEEQTICIQKCLVCGGEPDVSVDTVLTAFDYSSITPTPLFMLLIAD